jgi:MYXO-CTERM domain-containing protein
MTVVVLSRHCTCCLDPYARVHPMRRALAGMVAVAALAFSAPAGLAAVIPQPLDAGGSANHAPGSPGGTNRPATLDNPNFPNLQNASNFSTLDSDYNPSVINFPSGVGSGSTIGRVGLGNTQRSNAASILFARGTGISQSDPGRAQSFSTMEFTFGARWIVPSSGLFGPPITTAFNMPVAMDVGAGGSATVFIDAHWDVVIGTAPIPDARTPYTTTQSYGAGRRTVTFNAPPATFFVNTLSPGDVISMNGTVRFTANNDDAPTLIEIPTLADFPELAGQPELTSSVEMSVGDVPEPTVLGPIAAVGLLALGARRRRTNSCGRV